MAGSPYYGVQGTRNVQEYLYDFSVNGGLVSGITLGYLPKGAVIVNAVGVVETAATSAGSATVILGSTTDDNGLVASVAVAALVAKSTHGNSVAANMLQAKVAADQIVIMSIGTAALTAGKIRWMVEFYIPSNVVQSL